MKILVVEDEPSLASALLDLLADEGFGVDHAATGRAAAERVEQLEYDLVLLDWSLPPPSGAALLARWRGQGRRMPVLVLSGHGHLDEELAGLDAEHLPKPFSFADLLRRVHAVAARGSTHFE